MFKLPSDFCPDFNKMGPLDIVEYDFEIDLTIKSSTKITEISAPENAVCLRDELGTSATVKCKEPCDDFTVFYRS